jgi:hypothetical protein
MQSHQSLANGHDAAAGTIPPSKVEGGASEPRKGLIGLFASGKD